MNEMVASQLTYLWSQIVAASPKRIVEYHEANVKDAIGQISASEDRVWLSQVSMNIGEGSLVFFQGMERVADAVAAGVDPCIQIIIDKSISCALFNTFNCGGPQ